MHERGEGAARTGYRVPMPPAAARLRWPEAFGTRFTVFVDTEEEFDWSAPLARTGHSTVAARALGPAGDWFRARGVPLTFLVDQPIVDDPRAVAMLARLVAAGAAVGAQLHAWVTPPFAEALDPATSFAGNLPRTLEAAKLDHLTVAITRAFGQPPLAFRAGRYGIGPDTAALLAARGYRLDSSMRARYDYAREGGPDFRRVGSDAFWLAPDRTLVELPFTTVFTGRARRGGATLHDALGRVPFARGAAARLGLLSRVALTPEDMPVKEALEAVRVAVGEGVRVLNMSFHSPSLEPGHTPYVRDAGDLKAFFHWWEAVLALLARLDVRAASLDELLAAVDDARGL